MKRTLLLALAIVLLLMAAGCENSNLQAGTNEKQVAVSEAAPETEEIGPKTDTTPGLAKASKPHDASPDIKEQPSTSTSQPSSVTEVPAPQSSSMTAQTPVLLPSPEITPAPIVVQSVTVTVSSAQVVKGAIVEVSVSIFPENAEDMSYTLKSGNEDILQRTDTGWKAVGGGTTELIAVAAGGVTGRTDVTVVVPVEAVTLNISNTIMNRGDRAVLQALIFPADATDTNIKYASGNPDVVSVSDDGTINAVGAGTAIVECKVGGISTSCTVTVTVPVSSISVKTSRTTFKIGEQCVFAVQVFPEDATDKTFAVDLSGAAATVTREDIFLCDAAGNITITATAVNGVSGVLTINVIDLNAFADEVIRLVNIERENAGLGPLSQKTELTNTALMRADEIITLFSHTRPDGQNTWTAFAENNVSYNTAGENIAMGQTTPEMVVQDWMNSPGHKANILNADFGHLGVGVAMDNWGKLYWAQSFTD